MPIEPMADTLLTTAETAALLGRSTRTIEYLRKSGALDAVEVGNGPRPRIFFRQSEVLAHLAHRRGDHEQPLP